MKELSMISGEPFKAKVLRYSRSEMNKVVAAYVVLYQAGGHVFLSEEQKDEHNRKESDLFAFILKVGDIYVKAETYNRRMIESIPELFEKAEQMALNYTAHVESLVTEGRHVQLLYIRVFESLGLDTTPLWAAREARKKLQEAQKAQKLQEETQRKQQAQKQEEERLEQVKRDFINDEYIKTDDFLALCKRAGIDIHIRTKGTFNNCVISLQKSGSVQYYKVNGKVPCLDGCFKAIAAYRKSLQPMESNT